MVTKMLSVLSKEHLAFIINTTPYGVSSFICRAIIAG